MFEALFLFLQPDESMMRAITLSKQNHFQESQALLEKISPKKVKDADLYHFYMLLNAFQLNDKKTAEKHLRYIDEVFSSTLPERYQVLTRLMKADLAHWKQDDLGDVARDMKKVQDRLADSKAGKETRGIQDEIVKKLDKLIQEKENQQKQKQQEQQSQKGEQEQDAQNDPSNDPAQDSHLPDGGATPAQIQKKVDSLAKQWGSMPEKERAKAIVGLTREFPAKYRAAVEEYLKNISKKAK